MKRLRDRANVLERRNTVLNGALYSIRDCPFADSLVLQGGGALHFIYSSPRMSGDLDFVDQTIPQLGLGGYTCALDEWADGIYPINRTKALPPRGVRGKWGFEEGLPLAKVEIESRDLSREAIVTEGRFGPLRVKTPREIYADKVFANLSRLDARRGITRMPFKPNDFFDLNFIVQQLGEYPVPMSDIFEKGIAYGQEHLVRPAMFQEIVDLTRDPENHEFFRECMRSSMIPDVFNLHAFDAQYFNRAAIHFEQYT